MAAPSAHLAEICDGLAQDENQMTGRISEMRCSMGWTRRGEPIFFPQGWLELSEYAESVRTGPMRSNSNGRCRHSSMVSSSRISGDSKGVRMVASTTKVSRRHAGLFNDEQCKDGHTVVNVHIVRLQRQCLSARVEPRK
jgi:hypothetical protein